MSLHIKNLEQLPSYYFINVHVVFICFPLNLKQPMNVTKSALVKKYMSDWIRGAFVRVGCVRCHDSIYAAKPVSVARWWPHLSFTKSYGDSNIS